MKHRRLEVMPRIEYVVICYGPSKAYHYGAKYQILKNWKSYYSRHGSSICVVTDKPDLFRDYPVRICEITQLDKRNWSLNGLQHFGIKLRGLLKATQTSDKDFIFLLDTDAFWIRDPSSLTTKVTKSSAVMYCDEGKVRNTSNKSINQFNIGLKNKRFNVAGFEYQLGAAARMLNSRAIGITKDNTHILDLSFHLFSTLESHVNAHTVEQFSLGEAFRLKHFKVSFCKSFIRDWSSTGKKEYASVILNDFFSGRDSQRFQDDLIDFKTLQISRPFSVWLNQKLRKIKP